MRCARKASTVEYMDHAKNENMMKAARGAAMLRKEATLPATALRIKPLAKSIRTATILARMQRRIYPKEMQEDVQTLLAILESTDMSCGLFIGKKLVGYALFQGVEKAGMIYLYDIAILPRFQHRGLGAELTQGVLAAAWQKKLRIKMHVRAMSYPLFVNRERLRAAGYRLVSNKLLRDWYFGEFGIHEDAHELVMEPLERGPSTAA